MKAVILRQPRLLEWADVPEPALTAAHDVLIRVEACGICGSDLRYWEGDNPWALHTLGYHVPNPPNIILGHEYAGVVAKVNSPAYEHLLGKRVGPLNRAQARDLKARELKGTLSLAEIEPLIAH